MEDMTIDKLTAETITDDQIRALRLKALGAGDRDMEYTCTDALRKGVARIAKERMLARQRCADAINAAGAQVSL